MNFYAYNQIDELKHFLPSEPPRLRGIVLMRDEIALTSVVSKPESSDEIFCSFCGKDVIYIHTRCGGDNYEPCGMKDWEKNLGDLFIVAIDDEFDNTYRDTYIKIPGDKLDAYLSFLGITTLV